MKKKMFVFGLIAAGALFAQDMTAGTVVEQVGAADKGAEIVAQAESQAKEIAQQQPSEEFISAKEQVKRNLKRMKLFQGYNREKKAIIQIGLAEVFIKDPANEDDFMTVRSAKFREAYLNAKAEIIRAINTEFSAVDRAVQYAQFGDDDVSKLFNEKRVALDEKREELVKKLKQLDVAEANALKGVTMNDRFKVLLDGVLKKLNEEYAPAQIAEDKKALRDELKAECEALKMDYQALEKEATSIPAVPANETSSNVKMLSKMPLIGCSVLTQAESWDKNDKTYSIALALVWSPKLQENAMELLLGKEVAAADKGKYTPEEWIERQNLAVMIGPRRFIDNQGRNIFVGIAACDLTGSTLARDHKRKIADAEAIKAVAFSLTGDIEAFRETKQNFKEYDDGVRVSMAKLNNAVIAKCDANLRGCMQLDEKEPIYPITERKTYVTVYYIDPELATNTTEILNKAFSNAGIQVKATQYKRGQNEGMKSALENQMKSNVEKNKGFTDGKRNVEIEIQIQDNKAQNTQKNAPAGAAGSKVQNKNRQSQGGTFTGDQEIDTNF